MKKLFSIILKKLSLVEELQDCTFQMNGLQINITIMQTLKIDVKFASLTASTENTSANLKVTTKQTWNGYVHPKDSEKVAAVVSEFSVNPTVATAELCEVCPAFADYRCALEHALTECQWNLVFRNATALEIALEYYKKGDEIKNGDTPVLDEEGNQMVRKDDGLIVHFAKLELKDEFKKKVEKLLDDKFAM